MTQNRAAKDAVRDHAQANGRSYNSELDHQRRHGIPRKKAGVPYFRSIIRYSDDGAVYISGPSDNVHRSCWYEIRDMDKTTVLARVKGRKIVNLRREQLKAYLAQPGPRRRTNIAVIDVSALLP